MLRSPPTRLHLSRMYHELARVGARAVGEMRPWPYHVNTTEELVVLAADMSRYDPRLFGVLVEYLVLRWHELNPSHLREAMQTMSCPAVMGVFAEFIKIASTNEEASYFADYLCRGLKPQTPQLYFLGLYPPGSRLMQRASLESLEQFSLWGFLSRERPVLYGEPRQNLGYWGGAARQNIIRRLAQQQESLTIAEYLAALDGTISRQQALLDLKQSPVLRATGKGRGSAWQALT